MGGNANIARDESAARALTERPPPAYVRIRFPERRLTQKPLNWRGRALNAYLRSWIGQLGVRWFRRLRPGSRIRRLGYIRGVTLTYNASKSTRGQWFLSWEEGMTAAGLEGEPLPH